MMQGAPRPSLDIWADALAKAREAQTTLVNCDRSSLEGWEEAGQRGLHLLEARYQYFEILRQRFL
jgi:hypothetical protein